MKYKVGDKVRIVRTVKNSSNWALSMTPYLGETLTVKEVRPSGYYVEENRYFWDNYMIEGLAEWQPKEGEWVEVSDDGNSWQKRIYLHTFPRGKEQKFVSVLTPNEDEYNKGKDYYTSYRKYIRELKQEEKKKRELLMTDTEWEEFKKKNNILDSN